MKPAKRASTSRAGRSCRTTQSPSGSAAATVAAAAAVALVDGGAPAAFGGRVGAAGGQRQHGEGEQGSSAPGGGDGGGGGGGHGGLPRSGVRCVGTSVGEGVRGALAARTRGVTGAVSVQSEPVEQERPASRPWRATIRRDTEMGRLVEAHDWTSTTLGPPDRWSSGLRAAVSLCLNSRFPMLVVMGPDLVQVYNDAYRPLLGRDKHPAALGAPASVSWHEVWDVVGPMFESVLTTGVPTWEHDQKLVIERNGYPEECYLRYSYSPIFDDVGDIVGVLNVVTETTDEVLAKRRLGCLADLGAVLAAAQEITALCVAAVDVLARWQPDIASAHLYLDVDGVLARVASSRPEGSSPLPDAVLAEVRAKRRAHLARAGDDVPSELVALALGPPDGGLPGVLVLGLNRQRLFDEGYEAFTGLVASAIGAALDVAYRQALELGEYRRIADTLQSALLAPASDIPTVAARYLPAVGKLAVGGDWYDVIELSPTTRALVVGDCVGHGLEAAAAMSQLRSAARSLLYDGRTPAEVLDGLSRYAQSVDGARFATVVCAVVDRAAGTVTYARAGHLPPLVMADGPRPGSRWLDGAGGTPLAVDVERHYVEETVPLGVGQVMLLFSDGLVERRGESIDDGLERLRVLAESARGRAIHELADAVVQGLLPDGPSNDAVLVAKLVT